MNITCNTNNQKINEYKVCYEIAEEPYEKIALALLANKLGIEDEKKLKELKEDMIVCKLDDFNPDWNELDFKQKFLHEWLAEDVSWIRKDEDEVEKEWRLEKCKIVDEYRCFYMKEEEVNEWLEGYAISDIQFFIYEECYENGWRKKLPVAYAVYLNM